MLDAAWNDHPYRRPKTYVELLEQRQNRQARVLTGGHPRLDGGSREPPELSVSPRRRKAGEPSDSGAHAGPRDPHRAGRRVGWADAEPPATACSRASASASDLRSGARASAPAASLGTKQRAAVQADVAAAVASRTNAAQRRRAAAQAYGRRGGPAATRARAAAAAVAEAAAAAEAAAVDAEMVLQEQTPAYHPPQLVNAEVQTNRVVVQSEGKAGKPEAA